MLYGYTVLSLTMRKIIHVDMDCFFAAVEMRDNPALRDIPLAIGGSRVQRGVISTANYPARKFGVRSAMPTATALKLCPHLTLLPGRFDAYKEASNHIREIFSRYTSRIEPLSLDEAYLDVSDSEHCHGSATLIAREIRQTIERELRLTASAGVAPVKFLAKIASDMNKPNGQFVIAPIRWQSLCGRCRWRKYPASGRYRQRSWKIWACEPVAMCRTAIWPCCLSASVNSGVFCGSAATGLMSGKFITIGSVNRWAWSAP